MIVIDSPLVSMLLGFLWFMSPLMILGTAGWMMVRQWDKWEQERYERKYHYLKYKKNRKNNK